MWIETPKSLSFMTGNIAFARPSPPWHGSRSSAAWSGATPHSTLPELPHDVHCVSRLHAVTLLANAAHVSLVHVAENRHAACSGVTAWQSGLLVHSVAAVGWHDASTCICSSKNHTPTRVLRNPKGNAGVGVAVDCVFQAVDGVQPIVPPTASRGQNALGVAFTRATEGGHLG